MLILDNDDVQFLVTGYGNNNCTTLCVNLSLKECNNEDDSNNKGKAIADFDVASPHINPIEENVNYLNDSVNLGDLDPVIDEGGITIPSFRAQLDHALTQQRQALESNLLDTMPEQAGVINTQLMFNNLQPFSSQYHSGQPGSKCQNTNQKPGTSRVLSILPTYVYDEVNQTSSEVQFDDNDPGLHVGQVYNSKDELMKELSEYALRNNYEFRVDKSEPAFVLYVCGAGKNNCTWRLRAKITCINSKSYQSSKFVTDHTCGIRTLRKGDHRQAKPSVIAGMFTENIMSNGGSFRPCHLKDEIHKDFGITMSYQKAYQCREKAIHLVQGTPEESYSLLPSYFHMLMQKNPGTVCDIAVDDNNAFLYCYFALGVSLQGFRSCRPLICVDGTHLKNRYHGMLLSAIALDADDHLFPVAFAIVDIEEDDSYIYFLRWLRNSIGTVPGLVVISDRHPSIKNALNIVFPDAHHGICYYHLKGNLKSTYKEKSCDVDIRNTTYAYSEPEFWRHYKQIQAKNKDLAAYLDEIGFSVWSRAYFPGMRYAAITSNYCESFNSRIRDARKWSVTSLVEYIRSVLQRWHYERREEANGCRTVLATKMEERLKGFADRGRYYVCYPINGDQFEVKGNKDKHTVDLKNKTCTCKKFDINGIPCQHAASAILHRRGSVYEMCSPYFTVECLKAIYAGSVYPCGGVGDWIIPDVLKNMNIGLPIPRPMSGRPRKQRGRLPTKRIPSQGEKNTKSTMCSRCKQPGHNKATCRW